MTTAEEYSKIVIGFVVQRYVDGRCTEQQFIASDEVTYEDPNQQIALEVFNVHLGLSAIERRAQIRRLLNSPQMTHLSLDQRCLIAGDMNDWRSVLRRRHFSKEGFVCATNRCPGSRRSIKTYPSYAPAGELDKIFHRGHIKLLHVHRSRLQLAKVTSDHLPVIADFQI